MSACNVEVIKSVGRFYNAPVGTVCYNTDKVLTTVLNKQNVEGFASILLKLVGNAGIELSQEQMLLGYQWLEYIAMYANQAATNAAFATNFLKDINKALERNTYLTGQTFTVTDVATYYVLYPIINATMTIQIKSPNAAPPLPRQLLPHELKNVSLDKPVVFHPQPFSYPGYPVVLYL